MRRIFGIVIFTLTKEGDLLGQWMNNVTRTFQPENANRIPHGGGHGFDGIYSSRWNDNVGSITATLIIQANGKDQVLLNWNRLQNAIVGNIINTTYTGIGTIINNQLVCSYIMLN